MSQKILIVGAGAVGAVYGHFAQRGGADVAFLIKPKHRAERENGIRLYEHHLFGKAPHTIDFRGFKLYDSASSLPASEKFDSVIVTVPSDALKTGSWLTELAEQPSVSDSLWLGLSPGLEDADFIAEKTKAEPERLGAGTIPVISYWAPLPGENLEKPGYAFWIPPGSPFKIEPRVGEPSTRWKELGAVFQNGGMKTQFVKTFRKGYVVLDPLLRCAVAGLEKSEWSFQKFFHGPNLPLAADAVREMSTLYAARIGEPDPMRKWVNRRMATPFFMKFMLQATATLAPFDFETYLQAHFTKVGRQMHQGLREFIDTAKVKGRRPAALTGLAAGQPSI